LLKRLGHEVVKEKYVMSNLNRAWWGGTALVAAVAFAGCSDDDTLMHGASGSAGSEPIAEGGSAAGAGGASAGKGGGDKGGAIAAGAGGLESMTGAAGIANLGGAGAGGEATGGVGGEAGASNPNDALRALFAGMSPLPAVPSDTTNKYADHADAATLGQKFFFDKKFSGALTAGGDLTLGAVGDAQKVSCQTCHSKQAMDDGRAVSLGTGLHTRNAPPLVNSSFYTWTNWGGRFAAQWELPVAVVENPLTMNGNRLAVAHRIFDAYKADYEAVFETTLAPEIGTDAARFPLSGKPKPAPTTAVPNPPDGAWETMTAADKAIVNRILVNFSKALQAYTRKLVSRNAPFDAFMAGEDAALDPSAKKGAALFAGKAGCIKCHSGPSFSDQGFHVLGVPGAADDGRFKDVPPLLTSALNINSDFSDDKTTGKLDALTNPAPDTSKGAFRTPSLRSVAQSQPYMHAGTLATLSDVIDFYAVAGTTATASGELGSFAVTPEEKSDLIEFLKSLSGEAVPSALLVDTAKP
jgi:cytochrome c peroxidase